MKLNLITAVAGLALLCACEQEPVDLAKSINSQLKEAQEEVKGLPPAQQEFAMRLVCKEIVREFYAHSVEGVEEGSDRYIRDTGACDWTADVGER